MGFSNTSGQRCACRHSCTVLLLLPLIEVSLTSGLRLLTESRLMLAPEVRHALWLLMLHLLLVPHKNVMLLFLSLEVLSTLMLLLVLLLGCKTRIEHPSREIEAFGLHEVVRFECSLVVHRVLMR